MKKDFNFALFFAESMIKDSFKEHTNLLDHALSYWNTILMSRDVLGDEILLNRIFTTDDFKTDLEVDWSYSDLIQFGFCLMDACIFQPVVEWDGRVIKDMEEVIDFFHKMPLKNKDGIPTEYDVYKDDVKLSFRINERVFHTIDKDKELK